MRSKKEVSVKEHYKYLRDGKNHFWSSHARVFHDGLTEKNTEDHKEFVSGFGKVMSSSLINIISLYYEVTIGTERRCDILVSFKSGNKRCIECQLSKISKSELYNRSFYYLHSGFDVEWVLYKNYSNIQYIYSKLIKYCEHLGYLSRIIDRKGVVSYIIYHEKKEQKQDLHKLIIR